MSRTGHGDHAAAPSVSPPRGGGDGRGGTSDSAARRLWEAVKRVLTRIGEFQARVMLTVFYYVILGPFSLLVRRGDPLAISRHKIHTWGPAAPRQGSEIERAARQS